MSNQRHLQIRTWLAQQLGTASFSFEPASEDASPRKYFRVVCKNKSHILMDSPVNTVEFASFTKIAKLMLDSGIHAPRVAAFDVDAGLMLLDDLGSVQYLSKLDDNSVEQLYSDALNSLFLIQTRLSVNAVDCYSKKLLESEVDLFKQWYLETHCHRSLSDDDRVIWHRVCQLLVDNAIEQPYVFVHRDYHSRNLMVCHDNSPGILDFQDAVSGPVTYDLVSLLKDCYVSWSEDRISHWCESYRVRLQQQEIVDVSAERFKKWFDLMGMQRHLKAIGIFSRLHYRDGKSAYLADIPRTMNYVRRVCQHWPELSSFERFLSVEERLCMS